MTKETVTIRSTPPPSSALDLGGLRRQILPATDRLMEALGEKQHLWLRLDELLGDYRIHREAAYFDLGYEHGRAAGRTEGLAEAMPRCAGAPQPGPARSRKGR